MGSIGPDTNISLDDLGRGSGGGSSDQVAPLPPRDVVLSLRTGKVRPLGGNPKIPSGINKQPRQGRVFLSRRGLDGDERSFPPHQGPDNALFQYDPRHYEFWRRTLPATAAIGEGGGGARRQDFCRVGGFGENLSTACLSEDNVCVGDEFHLGPDAVIQVTMPRQPCFKLNHRFEYRRMSALTQATGRTGWYYRVLREGTISEGDEMVLARRPNPAWPLSRLQHFTYRAKDAADPGVCAEILRLEGLSAEFSALYEKRLAAGVAEDMSGRLNGTDALLWRPYRVVEKSALTPTITKFVFEAEDESPAAEERVGAENGHEENGEKGKEEEGASDVGFSRLGRFPHVRLKFGLNARFVRAYSVVCGDMRRFELGVARADDSRGGSQFLHDEVQVGDVLGATEAVSALRSTGMARAPRTGHHVFVLGGVGVTAFISEIRRLERASASLEVHYAVRSRIEAAYLEHLPAEKTTVYVRNEGRRLDVKSWIPPPSQSPSTPSTPEVMIYCCGPTSLMNACREQCQRLGYPTSHTHFEDFGGATTGTGAPFEVEIKSTGQVLGVPRDKSLFQVLNEAGFDIEGSCMVGNCGTCMVDHCGGEIVHHGLALDEEQKKEAMLSCVSRGKGRITVDC